MKTKHYQQLKKWIIAKINLNPNLFKRAYEKNGLPPKQYRMDLLLAINQGQWIKTELYSYLGDDKIDLAVKKIIKERENGSN